MLLSQKSVQEDLKLSDEQVTQVEELAAKQRESLSGLRDASREERMKKFAESREQGQKAVDTILNDEQRTRLKQITLQIAGPAAFGSPEVADKLGISDEQQKSIEEIQSANREEMRSLFQDADGDRAAAFRKMQAARQATEEKLKGVLTDEQKTKWDELVGKKFEGQLQVPGGRGFGGGRRGNRGAELRHERPLSDGAATVLTADKFDEGAAENKDGEVEKDSDKQEAKSTHKDSKRAHAKHAEHRGHGKHAARHHGRGTHARHASHRRGRHGHGHHRARGYHRGHGRGYAHHWHHGRSGGCFAQQAQRRSFGGAFHGRHFAHHGPMMHHFAPGHHIRRHPFGPGFESRHRAWNRMALAMGVPHGSRSFSHGFDRYGKGTYRHFHNGQHGPQHFAHRGHGAHRQHFAAHHRSHGQGEHPGHQQREMSGFGGPRPAHFAWHIEHHREDGPGFDRERGAHRPPHFHPASFQRRHHGGHAHGRPHKGGDHVKHGHKRHHKEEHDHKAREKHKDQNPDAGKAKDGDSISPEKKD
jgi:hypothetical protein